MKPERWAQIEELFHRAVECDGSQRDLLLEQACGGDLELRRDVDALLASDSSACGRVQAAIDSEVHDFGFSLVGEVVSHYRILDGLGGGGMGLVYGAEDVKLGRRVAIKFLPEDSATNPAALARFEREARAASALEHPNICPIYEFGEYEGRAFLVMPLLAGQTLQELLIKDESQLPKPAQLLSERGHQLPLDQILDLGIQIASGLEAAHQKNIVHRDIKPANIFVTSQGQVKILDFGLAKFAHSVTDDLDGMEDISRVVVRPRGTGESSQSETPDPYLSRTGVAMGTAGYMSPEQARGEKLDARSDIFSFGLVLYEIATGRRAFQGDTGPQLRNAILTQTPILARQLNPKLPPKLAQIISTAIQKDRTSRYQNIPDLRADLESVRRQIQPRKPYWWLAASAMVTVLLATLISVIKHQPSTALPSDIRFRQLTINSSENPVTSGALSPDGSFLGYVDTVGIHVKSIDNGSTQSISQPATLKNETVNWEIIDLGWLPDNTRFVVNAHPAAENQSAWSSKTTDIWLFSRANEAPRKLRGHAVAWSVSPDGKLISFGTNAGKLGERENWLMDPNGENARKLFDTGENSSIGGFVWSTDSHHGVYIRTDASGDTVWSRDVHGGPPISFQTASEFLKDARGDISLLPGGRLIYQRTETAAGINSEEDTCNFWEMRINEDTGKIIERPKQLTNWTGFCISSANPTTDGKKIAFLRNASQWSVYVADVESGGIRIANMRRLTLDESWNMTQDWTNDSKNVIFTSNRAGHFAIYKQSLESDQPELISTGTGSFRDTPATPDGKWLFAIPWPQSSDKDSNGLMRVPLSGGPPEFVTATLQDGVFCSRPPAKLCVLGERTADRKQLIFTSVEPGKGRGRELTRFALDPTIDYSDFDLSPDGTRLAVSGNTQGPIHILFLNGRPEQVIPTKFNDSQEFHWAADGKGLYVPDQIKKATVLLYLDLHGRKHVLWEQRGGGWIWARPSPDGRHLAIESSSKSNNFWMMENL